MNVIGFWLETALCELDVLFAGVDVEFFADEVAGVGLIERRGSVWVLLELFLGIFGGGEGSTPIWAGDAEVTGGVR